MAWSEEAMHVEEEEEEEEGRRGLLRLRGPRHPSPPARARARPPTDLRAVRDDGVELLEGLLRLAVQPEPRADDAEVVERLGAARLDADRFEVELLGERALPLRREAVALVDERLGVVPVVRVREVGVLLRVRRVALIEEEEEVEMAV